jgi:hypothetical protein
MRQRLPGQVAEIIDEKQSLLLFLRSTQTITAPCVLLFWKGEWNQ